MHTKNRRISLKLLTLTETLEDELPKDNILSEKETKFMNQTVEFHVIQENITNHNVNVNTHTWRLDSKYVHAEDN